MPQKFRKKPVTIEAVRFKGSSTHVAAIRAWMEGGEYSEPGISTCDMRGFTIPTLEGEMKALPGDWIIKGVQGEFYPCKPDIFEQTYEAA
ncbi:hypothetical protein ACT17S_11320 [Glutamicibacter mysorens]